MSEKVALALRAGEAESVTVAMNPAVEAQLGVPDSTPVFGSIVTPSTNNVFGLIRAILQCKAPWPFIAARVVEYEWPCRVGGSGDAVVIVSASGVGVGEGAPPPLLPPPPPQEIEATAMPIKRIVRTQLVLIPTPLGCEQAVR